jgi:protein-tyrosine phosphatase
VIDLHFHLLPAVDDGPADLATAVRLAALAQQDGCTAVVATPHQRHPAWDDREPSALRLSLTRVREAVRDAAPNVALHLGAEIRVHPRLLEELDRADHGGLLPLAGSRYLLLEFDRQQRPEVEPFALLHELGVSGWRPIIAHPEFVPWLADDIAQVRRLAERGALFQITALSLLGEVSRSAATFCRQLIDQGLAHFVASDAHSPVVRPPGLSRAYRLVAKQWSTEIAEALFRSHPAAVLADVPLPAAALGATR